MTSPKDPSPEASQNPPDWEIQITRLLLKGMSNQQIAVDLGLSEEAVRRHMNALQRKLRQTIRDAS